MLGRAIVKPEGKEGHVSVAAGMAHNLRKRDLESLMPSSAVIVVCGNLARRRSFVAALSGAGWEAVLAVSSERLEVSHDLAGSRPLADAG